jgi:hypothetical protein
MEGSWFSIKVSGVRCQKKETENPVVRSQEKLAWGIGKDSWQIAAGSRQRTETRN